MNLYPDTMWSNVSKKKKFIPRKLRSNEKLKLYKRYWIPYYGEVKVKDVFTASGVDYYQIIYNNGNMTGVLPFPIMEGSYELLKNFDNLESKDFVNKRKSIHGAEIKFWFTVNNIKKDDDNYSGFLDKLQYLDDSARYIVRRNKKKKEYEFIIQE